MRRFSILAIALLAIGCSSHSSLPAPDHVNPAIFQKHPLPFQKECCWTYTYLAKGYGPAGITTDLNHKVWVTSDSDTSGNGTLTKIAMNQRLTTYKLKVQPLEMTIGPDQNFWITTTHGISMVTPTGQETDFAIPTSMFLGYIINGPDGALWFGECSGDLTEGGVGRIDTQGNYTFYPVDCVEAIASGPDGNIWFSDFTPSRVYSAYSMDTKGQLLGKYPLGTSYPAPYMIAGNDGNLYATATLDLLRITTAGAVTNLGTLSRGMDDIVNGPDGNLWMISGNKMLIYDPKNDSWIGEIKSPYSRGLMTVAADGNLWVTGSNDRVNTYIYLMMTVSPNSLSLQTDQVVPVSVSETNYQGTWTATSSDVNVANVTLNSQNGAFQVNAVGPGTCAILVYDSQYNSAKVKVTVTP